MRWTGIRRLGVISNLVTHGSRPVLLMKRPIVGTDWNKSLFDGALTPETRGFIDEDGMPPWDCWLGIRPVANSVTGSCLVSWVPQWLSDEVDFGIRVDAAECLAWAELVMDDHIAVKQWGASWG